VRLLVLHLSDIHLRTESDFVLDRVGAIVDSVRVLRDGVTCVIVAISGDVAFSGRAAEYELAMAWTESLLSGLKRVFGDIATVHTVVVPGNHDCDFSTKSSARATLIDALARDADLANDPATVTLCVEPQREFFAFRDKVAAEETLLTNSPLYYEYRIAVTDEETVLLRCCNTAWVSQLPENPARLAFPEGAIPETIPGSLNNKDGIVISLMHHTYNWLAPANIRPVKRRLQAVSDFILTGHEHAFGVSHLRDEAGGTSVYVEGLALQGEGVPRSSGFNVVLIDTDTHQYRVVQMSWSVSRYAADTTAPCAEWTSYSTNPLRTGQAFPLTTAMAAELADPGVTLLHPSRGRLLLQDIFVYPDLREVKSGPSGGQPRTVSGESLLDLAGKNGRLLITGKAESGKSVLAKRLFLDALAAGKVPLLVDGTTIRLRGDDRDVRDLARVFADQYSASEEAFLAVPHDDRVIIVDDVSSLRTGKNSPARVVENLTSIGGRVILFSDDIEKLVQDVAGLAPVARGQTPFPHYRLLPMGHARREELIDLYVSLAADNDSARAEELRADMRRILSVAVGTYSAPPIPIAVVAILQARAFNEQLNLQHVTYGYYYELLIRRQLVGQSASIQEIDVQLAYLTELAAAVLASGWVDWTEAWMMSFHTSFVDERRLDLGFMNVLEVLTSRGVLSRQGDRLSFQHSYLFHYFVGRALAEELHTPEGASRVAGLTEHLDEQQSANILLFLTHQSKDAAILDPMLAQADSLFADSPAASLSSRELELEGLDESLRGAAYEERSIGEARRQFLERLDAAPGESATGEGLAPEATPPAAQVGDVREERDAAVRSVVDISNRIAKSFRTMQILGQLLKNFPGTLTGSQKERITQSVYGVARRTLGFIQRYVIENRDAVAATIVDGLRNQYPDMSTTDLVLAARTSLHWQLYMVSYSMVQRTASDVEAPLLDPVFRAISISEPIPVIKLITLALSLHRAGTFPDGEVRGLYQELERNPLGRRVMRSLVITHFHLFDVKREAKQSICSLLEIDYRPLSPGSRTRMVGPGAPPKK
jgi:hypothetical protein